MNPFTPFYVAVSIIAASPAMQGELAALGVVQTGLLLIGVWISRRGVRT